MRYFEVFVFGHAFGFTSTVRRTHELNRRVKTETKTRDLIRLFRTLSSRELFSLLFQL